MKRIYQNEIFCSAAHNMKYGKIFEAVFAKMAICAISPFTEWGG